MLHADGYISHPTPKKGGTVYFGWKYRVPYCTVYTFLVPPRGVGKWSHMVCFSGSCCFVSRCLPLDAGSRGVAELIACLLIDRDLDSVWLAFLLWLAGWLAGFGGASASLASACLPLPEW